MNDENTPQTFGRTAQERLLSPRATRFYNAAMALSQAGGMTPEDLAFPMDIYGWTMCVLMFMATTTTTTTTTGVGNNIPNRWGFVSHHITKTAIFVGNYIPKSFWWCSKKGQLYQALFMFVNLVFIATTATTTEQKKNTDKQYTLMTLINKKNHPCII